MLAAIGTSQVIVLLVVGTAAGILGGLLGVGGAIVMIPAMIILLGDHFGPDSFHAYKLAANVIVIVVSIPAAARHYREKAVVGRMLPGIMWLSVVGVVAGVAASSQLVGERTRLLKQIFGGVMEFVVLVNVCQAWCGAHGESALRDSCPVATRHTLYGLVVGLPAGLVGGVLGVGGGIWAVPAQRLLLGVALRNAIANSCVMIVLVSALTALGQGWVVAHMPSLHSADAYWLSLCLAPGAVLGAWWGAGLTHRLPTGWLRVAFNVLLAVAGVRLILS